MTRSKSILVTGGAGYIGSPLIRLLLNNNYNVITLDNLMFGGETMLGVWHHPNFRFVLGDINNPDDIKTVFDEYKINAVVHLAAIVGDPACSKFPELAHKTNWEGSVNLVEQSIENSVERFIFASTCSNYGKMSDPDSYVTESSPLSPVSLYAELKVKFENFILNETDQNQSFCPTALRFATVYGVSPRVRFDLTVNEFTKELAMGRELEVFGKDFWRPYCHVYDFARAMLLILKREKEKVAYNVFNVGSTEENYQKQMLIDEIKEYIPDAQVRYVHKNEDPRDYRVNFDKIKNELGFDITQRVTDGVKEIKYLIDHKILLNPDDAKYKNI